MDTTNFDVDIQNLQNKIDEVNKILQSAKDDKLVAATRLEHCSNELDSLVNDMQNLFGTSDINELNNIMNTKAQELTELANTINNYSTTLMNASDNNYSFNQNDIDILTDIINRYNIPVTQ